MSNVPYYVLTEHQRQVLKQPLGELVTGSEKECNLILKRVVEKEKPRLLILVGDTISRNAIQSGLTPNVLVIDNLEKRVTALPFEFQSQKFVRTHNPAGRIEMQAWHAVEQAIRESNTLVEVDGEEDLLTIPAVLSAPTGAMVVYGQPNVGIVIVRVSETKKSETRRALDSMQRVE